MTTALEGGEGSASRPGLSLPPGKTRYPLYRRLDGPQGRSGQVPKISPPPGFDPRTVQPVASRYTRSTEQCWVVTKVDFARCTKDRVSPIASCELRLSALRCHQRCSDHALVLLLPLGDLIACNKNCCNSASHGCQISSLVATDL